jgi:hypothetical protein
MRKPCRTANIASIRLFSMKIVTLITDEPGFS